MAIGFIEWAGMFLALLGMTGRQQGPKMSNAEFSLSPSGQSSARYSTPFSGFRARMLDLRVVMPGRGLRPR
jgi:hypothetical protein